MSSESDQYLISITHSSQQIRTLLPRVIDSLNLLQGIRLSEAVNANDPSRTIIAITIRPRLKQEEIVAIAICSFFTTQAKTTPKEPITNTRQSNSFSANSECEEKPTCSHANEQSDVSPAVSLLLNYVFLQQTDDSQSKAALELLRIKIEEEMQKANASEMRYCCPAAASQGDDRERIVAAQIFKPSTHSLKESESRSKMPTAKNEPEVRYQPDQLGFKLLATVNHMQLTLPSHHLNKSVLFAPCKENLTPLFLQGDCWRDLHPVEGKPTDDLSCRPIQHEKNSPYPSPVVDRSNSRRLIIQSLNWDSPLEYEYFSRQVEKTYENTKDCLAHNQFFSTQRTLREYQASRTFDRDGWLLIKDQVTGQTAGCLILAVDRPESLGEHRAATTKQTSDCVELVYLGVAPLFRRTGIGKCLLRITALYSQFWEREKILVSVDQNNLPAMNLYSQTGFYSTEIEDIWIKMAL